MYQTKASLIVFVLGYLVWTSFKISRWPQTGDEPNVTSESVLGQLYDAVCSDDVAAVRAMVDEHQVSANAYYFSSKLEDKFGGYSAIGGPGYANFSVTCLHLASACGSQLTIEYLAKALHGDLQARDARRMVPLQVILSQSRDDAASSSLADSELQKHLKSTYQATLSVLFVPCSDLHDHPRHAFSRSSWALQPNCTALDKQAGDVGISFPQEEL